MAKRINKLKARLIALEKAVAGLLTGAKPRRAKKSVKAKKSKTAAVKTRKAASKAVRRKAVGKKVVKPAAAKAPVRKAVAAKATKRKAAKPKTIRRAAPVLAQSAPDAAFGSLPLSPV